jgi:parvulin-like peptidyl-prolyl isomerase
VKRKPMPYGASVLNRSVLAALIVGVALLAAACSSAGPVVSVDGVEIGEERFEELHVDVDRLDEDERAGSTLLLVLREAFARRAESDFGIVPDPDLVDAAFVENSQRYPARQNVDLSFATANVKRERVVIESELDVLRDLIGEELVRSEADGFDLDEAYQAYLIDNAEVCVRQITLVDVNSYDQVVAELEAGEDFGDVARLWSSDPFVDRDDGGVGAGGDLGCSAPAALPTGLDVASLEAPVGEPFGPVTTDVGFHLLWIDERTAADLAEVKVAVIDHAVPRQGPDLFRRWAVDVLQDITVVVGEDYGTWGVLPETAEVPTVVPVYRVSQIIS